MDIGTGIILGASIVAIVAMFFIYIASESERVDKALGREHEITMHNLRNAIHDRNCTDARRVRNLP